MSDLPGRTCPIRYRYGAQALASAPTRVAQTLYVVGGLYGNLQALDALEALAARVNKVLAGQAQLDTYSRAHLKEIAARVRKVQESRLEMRRP